MSEVQHSSRIHDEQIHVCDKFGAKSITLILFHVESCLSNNWLWLWISKMSEFSEQQHFINRSKWQDITNVLYISFLISFSGWFPFSVKLWTIWVSEAINGWQLAKMKKSIPDMSLPWNLQGWSSWSKKFQKYLKNYDICENVKFGAISWKFDILSITA